MQRSILDLFRHQTEPRELQSCLKIWKDAGVLGGNIIAIKKSFTSAIANESLSIGSQDPSGTWHSADAHTQHPGLLVRRGPAYPNEEESVIGSNHISDQISSARRGKVGASLVSLEARIW